jgi:mannose-6-phosphate isomerase-like protein (cupin superfamily)
MQRHFKRSEHWYVLKGQCNIKTVYNNVEMTVPLLSNTSYVIDTMVWHQGINNTNVPCHILEVQYGEICVEEDIERQ